MMSFLGEHHHLVLFRTSAELLAATLRKTFDEHIKLFAFVCLVLLGRDFRLLGDQLIETADLLLFRNIIRQML